MSNVVPSALGPALFLLAHLATAQETLHEIYGTRALRLDGTLAPIGDFDRDGATDFLAGGVGGVFSGRTGKRLGGPPLGLGPVDGQSGNVGDVNGDGTDELLLFGYAICSGAELISAGNVRPTLKVLTGFSNPLIEAWSPGDALALEDTDADGVSDVLLGFTDVQVIRCGGDQVTLWFGPTGGFGDVYSGRGDVLRWRAEGIEPHDGLGGFLARVSDMDADGLDDVLVGTRWVTYWPFFCNMTGGRYLQARSAVDGALLWSLAAPQHVPISAAGMDDVDGDSVPDLALGFTWSQPIEVRSGANGALLWTIEHGNSLDWFGYRLAAIADLDGDSVRDLVIAAPQPAVHSASPGPGFVRIVSGLSGATLVTLHGRTVGSQFGLSIAVLGDVNGDGHSELAVGAPYEGPGGLVQVISVKTPGTAPRRLRR